MGSKKKVTVGHWYKMGIHAVLCHGPVDAIQSFIVGDRTAWLGNVTSNTSLQVDQPELFGGEKREGGVVGTIDVLMGADNQAPNACLQSVHGSTIPAYRGITSVVFRGTEYATQPFFLGGNRIVTTTNGGFTWSAMNPYLKPFWFTVRHITAGRPWYTAKAAIGVYDMNPAHILWDVMTNTKYGLGIPTAKMDDAAFKAVADKLFTESFGISLEWKSSMSAWDFIQTVLDHITGLLYVDPATGLFTIKIIRDDYVVGDLLTLDTSNITKFGSFERATWGEITNTIVLTYTNRATGGKTDVTVHNLAAIRNQGGQVITSAVELLGICDQTLAQRIAQRDLRVFSTPLVKVSLEINRVGYNLRPGSVIKLNWEPLGISNMVMRVTNIEYGTLADGKIKVDLAEDVFGMPNTSYMGNQADLWVDPVGPPQPITKQRAMEASFFEVNRSLSPSVIADYDPDFGFGKVLVAKPEGLAVSFDMRAAPSVGGSYVDVGDGVFVPTATLSAGVDRVATKFPVSSLVDFNDVDIGTVGYVDNEAFSYEGYDDSDGTVVVKRGVLDTVPAVHSTGADIYFDVDQMNVDDTERLSGETVYYKLLTTNGYGAVAESLATAVNVTLNRRYQRPYPPGNLKVAGQYFPAAIIGDVTLTWAHRDRVQQTVGLVGFTEGNIGPEAGTTYTVRVYDDNGDIIETVAGLSGTSWTYLDEGGGVGDPHFTSVVSLLNFNGLDDSTVFTDVTGKTWTVTGSAKLSTEQSQFGGSSLELTPVAETRIDCTHSDFNFGTGDFTIEVFSRPGATSGRSVFSFGSRLVYAASGSWVYFNGSNVISGGSVAATSFTHLALVRSAGTVTLFVAGTPVGSASDAGAINPGTMRLGYFNGGNPSSEYVDAFRVTKGVARYTGAFTPPSAEYPQEAGEFKSRLRVTIESVRDGLTSMQKHDHTFERAGLGFSLGKYLGGV